MRTINIERNLRTKVLGYKMCMLRKENEEDVREEEKLALTERRRDTILDRSGEVI